mgnify:CR=1 FL=1
MLSTLSVLALIMGIFDLTVRYTGGLDYSSMEYLGSMDDPGELFRAEIMLAGLGAIMDVTVTIFISARRNYEEESICFCAGADPFRKRDRL